MLSCFYKTCPCLPRRDTQPPFNNYSYDDDDDNHLEFENLLAQQDSDSVAPFSFLSRDPFSRAPNTQGYLRVHTMGPNDDQSGGASDRGSVLLDDEAQTLDAQFLPDEQISKLTEINGDQSKHSQVTDAELAAEEDEARRLEEQEIEKNRQTAKKIAIAKGLIHPNGDPNKDTIFTIADGDGDDDADEFGNASGGEFGGGASVELSQQPEEQQLSTLNRPRNPHQRLLAKDLNLEDYEDGTESDGPPPTNSKDQSLDPVETPLGPHLSVNHRNEA